MNERLHTKILRSNIELHDKEAPFYDQIHSAIWNRVEQLRIIHVLQIAASLIDDPHGTALDFGAGTGNLTGKLLQMGFTVYAVDVSPQMCSILKKRFAHSVAIGTLKIINADIADLRFSEPFDLIACYSVLHHLFHYLDVIQTLTTFLKDGGVMYLDHEASPSFWHMKTSPMRRFYRQSGYLLTKFYKFVKQIKTPSFNYEWVDYHTTLDHRVDHDAIEQIFRENHFTYYTRKDYHLHRTMLINPFFAAYRLLCQPDKSYWIAKK